MRKGGQGVFTFGTTGPDPLAGTGGPDTIDGLAGDDRIRGRQGHDRLFGGLGDDSIAGGAGDDLLDGSLGRNLLAGGAGADTFSFGAFGQGNLTRVADFSAAEGDRLFVFAFSDDTPGGGPESFEDGVARGLIRLDDTPRGLLIAFDDGLGSGLVDTILLSGVTSAGFSGSVFDFAA